MSQHRNKYPWLSIVQVFQKYIANDHWYQEKAVQK